MAERVTTSMDALFELALCCNAFVINDSFRDLYGFPGRLKHDENGSFWYSHALETVPNGTSFSRELLCLPLGRLVEDVQHQ